MQPLSLEDRWDIHDLLARYNRYIDDGDREQVPELFTQTGRLVTMGQTLVGRPAIREFFSQMPPKQDQRPSTQHHLTNVILRRGPSEEIAAESDYLVIDRSHDGNYAVALAGRYRDRLVRVDGIWHLAERAATGLRRAPGAAGGL